MATIEKRITITPTAVTAPLLRELSALTGKPQATIVRELLDEAAPALQATVEAMRLVKKRPEEAMAAFQRMAIKAHAELAQLQLDIASTPHPLAKKPGRKPGTKPKPRKRGPSSG